MDLKRLQEPFSPRDVEFRCQTLTKGGDKGLALAYIDSRAVQERLDEVAGPANWQCRYSFSPDAKKTLCEIGILVERNTGVEWVWKADGAGDSDVEPEKGALSDAFKRAGVKWGIGRYLYDLPALWVPCESRDWNGKKQWVKWTADPRASLSEAQGRAQQAESRGDQRAAQQPRPSPGRERAQAAVEAQEQPLTRPEQPAAWLRLREEVKRLYTALGLPADRPSVMAYLGRAAKKPVREWSDLDEADLGEIVEQMRFAVEAKTGQPELDAPAQQGKLAQEQGA